MAYLREPAAPLPRAPHVTSSESAARRTGRTAARLLSALCFASASALVVPACSSPSATHDDTTIAEADAASALVDAICKPMFHDCGCASTAFPSEAACAKQVKDLFATFQSEAHANGLTYDGTCTRSIVSFYAQGACAAPAVVTHLLASCAMSCRMFHGSLPVDATCKLLDEVNECAQGLGCQRPVTDGMPVGPSQCRPSCFAGSLQAGDHCQANAPTEAGCGPDLVCSDAGVCSPLPDAGSGCDKKERCAAGAFCTHQLDGPPICVERSPGGAHCNGDTCASGDCVNGTCAPVVPYACTLGPTSYLF